MLSEVEQHKKNFTAITEIANISSKSQDAIINDFSKDIVTFFSALEKIDKKITIGIMSVADIGQYFLVCLHMYASAISKKNSDQQKLYFKYIEKFIINFYDFPLYEKTIRGNYLDVFSPTKATSTPIEVAAYLNLSDVVALIAPRLHHISDITFTIQENYFNLFEFIILFCHEETFLQLVNNLPQQLKSEFLPDLIANNTNLIILRNCFYMAGNFTPKKIANEYKKLLNNYLAGIRIINSEYPAKEDVLSESVYDTKFLDSAAEYCQKIPPNQLIIEDWSDKNLSIFNSAPFKKATELSNRITLEPVNLLLAFWAVKSNDAWIKKLFVLICKQDRYAMYSASTSNKKDLIYNFYKIPIFNFKDNNFDENSIRLLFDKLDISIDVKAGFLYIFIFNEFLEVTENFINDHPQLLMLIYSTFKTALHYAVMASKPEMVRLLKKSQIFPEATIVATDLDTHPHVKEAHFTKIDHVFYFKSPLLIAFELFVLSKNEQRRGVIESLVAMILEQNVNLTDFLDEFSFEKLVPSKTDISHADYHNAVQFRLSVEPLLTGIKIYQDSLKAQNKKLNTDQALSILTPIFYILTATHGKKIPQGNINSIRFTKQASLLLTDLNISKEDLIQFYKKFQMELNLSPNIEKLTNLMIEAEKFKENNKTENKNSISETNLNENRLNKQKLETHSDIDAAQQALRETPLDKEKISLVQPILDILQKSKLELINNFYSDLKIVTHQLNKILDLKPVLNLNDINALGSYFILILHMCDNYCNDNTSVLTEFSERKSEFISAIDSFMRYFCMYKTINGSYKDIISESSNLRRPIEVAVLLQNMTLDKYDILVIIIKNAKVNKIELDFYLHDLNLKFMTMLIMLGRQDTLFKMIYSMPEIDDYIYKINNLIEKNINLILLRCAVNSTEKVISIDDLLKKYEKLICNIFSKLKIIDVSLIENNQHIYSTIYKSEITSELEKYCRSNNIKSIHQSNWLPLNPQNYSHQYLDEENFKILPIQLLMLLYLKTNNINNTKWMTTLFKEICHSHDYIIYARVREKNIIDYNRFLTLEEIDQAPGLSDLTNFKYSDDTEKMNLFRICLMYVANHWNISAKNLISSMPDFMNLTDIGRGILHLAVMTKNLDFLKMIIRTPGLKIFPGNMINSKDFRQMPEDIRPECTDLGLAFFPKSPILLAFENYAILKNEETKNIISILIEKLLQDTSNIDLFTTEMNLVKLGPSFVDIGNIDCKNIISFRLSIGPILEGIKQYTSSKLSKNTEIVHQLILNIVHVLVMSHGKYYFSNVYLSLVQPRITNDINTKMQFDSKKNMEQILKIWSDLKQSEENLIIKYAELIKLYPSANVSDLKRILQTLPSNIIPKAGFTVNTKKNKKNKKNTLGNSTVQPIEEATNTNLRNIQLELQTQNNEADKSQSINQPEIAPDVNNTTLAHTLNDKIADSTDINQNLQINIDKLSVDTLRKPQDEVIVNTANKISEVQESIIDMTTAATVKSLDNAHDILTESISLQQNSDNILENTSNAPATLNSTEENKNLKIEESQKLNSDSINSEVKAKSKKNNTKKHKSKRRRKNEITKINSTDNQHEDDGSIDDLQTENNFEDVANSKNMSNINTDSDPNFNHNLEIDASNQPAIPHDEEISDISDTIISSNQELNINQSNEIPSNNTIPTNVSTVENYVEKNNNNALESNKPEIDNQSISANIASDIAPLIPNKNALTSTTTLGDDTSNNIIAVLQTSTLDDGVEPENLNPIQFKTRKGLSFVFDQNIKNLHSPTIEETIPATSTVSDDIELQNKYLEEILKKRDKLALIEFCEAKFSNFYKDGTADFFFIILQGYFSGRIQKSPLIENFCKNFLKNSHHDILINNAGECILMSIARLKRFYELDQMYEILFTIFKDDYLRLFNLPSIINNEIISTVQHLAKNLTIYETVYQTIKKLFGESIADNLLDLSSERRKLPATVTEIYDTILTTGEHFLTGSSVHDVLRDQNSANNDFDFISRKVDIKSLMTVHNFWKSEHIPGLYTYRNTEKNLSIDIYVVNDHDEASIWNFLRFISKNHHDFTICDLSFDRNGKLYDPSGRGLSDFNNKILCTINSNALDYLIKDFRIYYRAFKYMFRGFEHLDSDLREALNKLRGNLTISREEKALYTKKILQTAAKEHRLKQLRAFLIPFNSVKILSGANQSSSLTEFIQYALNYIKGNSTGAPNNSSQVKIQKWVPVSTDSQPNVSANNQPQIAVPHESKQEVAITPTAETETNKLSSESRILAANLPEVTEQDGKQEITQPPIAPQFNSNFFALTEQLQQITTEIIKKSVNFGKNDDFSILEEINHAFILILKNHGIVSPIATSNSNDANLDKANVACCHYLQTLLIQVLSSIQDPLIISAVCRKVIGWKASNNKNLFVYYTENKQVMFNDIHQKLLFFSLQNRFYHIFEKLLISIMEAFRNTEISRHFLLKILNKKDFKGRSLLNLSVEYNQIHAVKSLLEIYKISYKNNLVYIREAIQHDRNNNHLNAFQISCINEQGSIIELLSPYIMIYKHITFFRYRAPKLLTDTVIDKQQKSIMLELNNKIQEIENGYEKNNIKNIFSNSITNIQNSLDKLKKFIENDLLDFIVSSSGKDINFSIIEPARSLNNAITKLLLKIKENPTEEEENYIYAMYAEMVNAAINLNEIIEATYLVDTQISINENGLSN